MCTVVYVQQCTYATMWAWGSEDTCSFSPFTVWILQVGGKHVPFIKTHLTSLIFCLLMRQHGSKSHCKNTDIAPRQGYLELTEFHLPPTHHMSLASLKKQKQKQTNPGNLSYNKKIMVRFSQWVKNRH